MTKYRWFSAVVLMVVLALCITGCSRKGGGRRGDNVGDLTGAEGSGLPGREGDITILSNVKYDAVLFDYDSAQIRESERSKLDAVADYLKKNAGTGVIVEGNCDERGSAEYNLALGERRSLAARAYLVGLGVDGNNIQTKSYGEERPVNPGHDDAAWKVNRRDDFVIFKR